MPCHAKANVHLDDHINNELQQLIKAALPSSRYVTKHRGREASTYHLPLSAWREAEAMLLVSVQRWLDKGAHVTDDEKDRLCITRVLPGVSPSYYATETIWVNDKPVEVMRDVHDVNTISERFRWHQYSDRISRRFFRSAPHLQCLELTIDVHQFSMPSIDASIHLVPHLRHLRVEHSDSSYTPLKESILDIHAALHALPQLTSLHCQGLCVSIADLLLIASHSTLDSVVIGCEWGVADLDTDWLGDNFDFPSHNDDDLADEDESDENAEQANSESDVKGDEAGDKRKAAPQEINEIKNEEGTISGADAEATEQRLRSALRRTQPTLRSLETRLALVKLVQSRICRRSLRVGTLRPMSLLTMYRRHAELVQSTLQQQHEQLLSMDEVDAAPSTSSEPNTKRAGLYSSCGLVNAR